MTQACPVTFCCRSLCPPGISFKLVLCMSSQGEDSVQLLRGPSLPQMLFCSELRTLGSVFALFCRANPPVCICCRPFTCSERGREEMLSLQHHPNPRWGGSGCKAGGGASVPGGGPGPLEPPRQPSRTPCPRPLPTGAQGPLPDAGAVPVTPLGPAPPAPGPSSYCFQPPTPAGTPRSRSHSPAGPPSPERGLEEGARRQASQAWLKLPLAASWEDSLPEGPQRSPRPHDLPASSSTSDPDTPPWAAGAQGRISLRISESALLASPPPREDDDDDVFVRERCPTSTASPAHEAPPSREAPARILTPSRDLALDLFPPPPPHVCPAPPPPPQDSEGCQEPQAR